MVFSTVVPILTIFTIKIKPHGFLHTVNNQDYELFTFWKFLSIRGIGSM